MGNIFGRSILVLIVVPVLLGLLTACTPEMSSSEREAPPTETEEEFSESYKSASCKFSVDDGDSITQNKPEPKVVSGPFEKLYDRAQFLEIRSASPRSIVRFAELHSLDIFVAQTKKLHGACENLVGLPAAPAWAQQEWDSIKSKSILGLFLSRQKTASAWPAMIIRPDTNQYTIVHEYMHFLFNRERDAAGQDDTKVSRRLDRAYQELIDMPKEDIRRVDRYFDYLDALLPIYISYPLEEMSIEALMTEEYRNQNLKLATDFDREASAWYIRDKFKETSTDLTAVIDRLKKIQEALIDSSNAEDKARLERAKALQKQIYSILVEADEINQKYANLRQRKNHQGKSMGSRGLDMSGVSGSHQHTDDTHKCAHEAAFEKYKKYRF